VIPCCLDNDADDLGVLLLLADVQWQQQEVYCICNYDWQSTHQSSISIQI
jgi:hypothetical protein